MAMSNRERQAKFQGQRRLAMKALADALAEVEALRASAKGLQCELDRYKDLVGYALKQEEWAEERRRKSDTE
ncbi:hypothetical protein D3273_22875 [Lichenibacterium minor]|uniref:Uncharacterized protein n=1 Tax=Lichenibacterium minor TaxID=2316528 RepID=A0A4Q2U1S4_9HYPH|nr:hypothetical protein [Lichenibacterium minor]RYC29658.1 hypothetical protein D3273_22875 [Lichenibacterium minor]